MAHQTPPPRTHKNTALTFKSLKGKSEESRQELFVLPSLS